THSFYRLSSPILAPSLRPPFREGEHTEPPRRLESLGGGHEWNRSGLPFHGLRRHALVLLLVCPLLYILPQRIHTLDLPLASDGGSGQGGQAGAPGA
ncbi:unnamed protein product, partial [Urochloa humidicola]